MGSRQVSVVGMLCAVLACGACSSQGHQSETSGRDSSSPSGAGSAPRSSEGDSRPPRVALPEGKVAAAPVRDVGSVDRTWFLYRDD